MGCNRGAIVTLFPRIWKKDGKLVKEGKIFDGQNSKYIPSPFTWFLNTSLKKLWSINIYFTPFGCVSNCDYFGLISPDKSSSSFLIGAFLRCKIKKRVQFVTLKFNLYVYITCASSTLQPNLPVRTVWSGNKENILTQTDMHRISRGKPLICESLHLKSYLRRKNLCATNNSIFQYVRA